MQDKAATIINALSEFEHKDWAWVTLDALILMRDLRPAFHAWAAFALPETRYHKGRH
jgi:hypothetical protein